jgi:hypothetical protein
MQRTMRVIVVVSLAAAGASALAQDKPPGIKEIMARLNKPGGVYPTISRALKAEAPDWDEIRLEAKTFVKLADALGKNAPPTGDPGSWATRTKAYADHARALEDAADKKDRAAAGVARAGLGGEACKTCHAAHKKQ